jgi:hypothetical protein
MARGAPLQVSLKLRRRPNERGSGGPCRVSLLFFEPEGITVSVKLDSCYRSFSSFSAPGGQALASRPEIAGSARNPADKPRPPWPVSRRCPSAAKNPKGNFPPCKALKNHKMEKESHPSPAKKTHGTELKNPRSAEIISTAAARGDRRGISRMRGVERPPFDEGCGIWGANRACIWFPADPPQEYPTRKSDAESPPGARRKRYCGRRTAGSVGAVAGSSRARRASGP